jgi:predicted lipid-binding transport protein (Tim44 family)
MRRFIPWLIAPPAVLAVACKAWAQAGEYLPPIEPFPISGGGSPSVPFIPWHWGGSSGDAVGSGPTPCGWLILMLTATLFLLYVGILLGQALGRWSSAAHRTAGRDQSPKAARAPAPAPGFASVPAMDTLILSVSEVVAKAVQTEGLLQQLASRDPLFEPTSLRDGLGRLFHLVQQCWQARDYGPLHDLLTPDILAKHEALLLSMRRHAEINRVEDVRITRFEFVHVFCPCDAGRQEVTALITFEARVYFVNEVTSAFLRGSRQVGLYQEFWTFRRHESAWRLRTIEQSHESAHLRAENHVEETPAGLAPGA